MLVVEVGGFVGSGVGGGLRRQWLMRPWLRNNVIASICRRTRTPIRGKENDGYCCVCVITVRIILRRGETGGTKRVKLRKEQ